MNDPFAPAGPPNPVDDPMLDAVEDSIVNQRPFHDPGLAPGGDPMLDAAERSIVDPSPAGAPVPAPWAPFAGPAAVAPPDTAQPLLPQPAPLGERVFTDMQSGLAEVLERSIESTVQIPLGQPIPPDDRLPRLMDLLEQTIEPPRLERWDEDRARDHVQRKVMDLLEKSIEQTSPRDPNLDEIGRRLDGVAEGIKKVLNSESEMAFTLLEFEQGANAGLRLLIAGVVDRMRMKQAITENQPTYDGGGVPRMASLPDAARPPERNTEPSGERQPLTPRQPAPPIRRAGRPRTQPLRSPRAERLRPGARRASGARRYCSDAQEAVPLSQCDSCDKFRNWSDGTQEEPRQCFHDWAGRQRRGEFLREHGREDVEADE